jgi:hypothetical protein
MKTRTEPATSTPLSPPPWEPGRSWVRSIGTVALAGLLVSGFFLFIYPLRGLEVPIGWDSTEYVWRTRLAQDVGVANYTDAVPPTMVVKEGRPAYLVAAATLSSVASVSVLQIAVVLPAVMAAVMGLAAGAFARMGAGLPWWGLPYAGVAMGVSINVVLMYQYGYGDNLMTAAVLMAWAISVALAVEDRRALVPAILLTGAGGFLHGPIFAIVAAVLGVTAVLYLPSSWRRWRSGSERLLDTPSARMGEVLLGGGALAGALLYATVSTPPTPRLNRLEFAKKLREDIPRYRFPLLIPLAGLGVASLAPVARREGGRRRFVFTLLLVWAITPLVGYIIFRASSFPFPANRILLFALCLPLLAVIGVIWAGQRLMTSRPAGARIFLGGALAIIVLLSAWEWYRSPSYIDPEKLKDAAAAQQYLTLTDVPTQRPVVFIVEDRGALPAAVVPHMRDHIFAAFPTERIASTYVYVGSPENYLARRPTLMPEGGNYNNVSNRFFDRMAHTYDQDPIALIASSYNVTHFHRWVDEHPDTQVPTFGLAVVRGPDPPSLVPTFPAPTGPQNPITLALLAGGSLAILGLIGFGWTLVLFRRWLGRMEIVALAPVIGLALLIIGGAMIDRLGVRLGGFTGTLTPLAVAAVGWALLWLFRRRHTSGESIHPAA